MKVVQITDDDAKSLLAELEIGKYRGPTWWSSSQYEIDQNTRDALVNDVHRHFHFYVTRWLQRHGATVT